MTALLRVDRSVDDAVGAVEALDAEVQVRELERRLAA